MLGFRLCESCSVHFNIPKSEQEINDLVVCCKEASRDFFRLFFEKVVVSIQIHILDHALGRAWQPHQVRPTPWECPRCGSRYNFKRRGKRKRILKTSHGEVQFSLLQVTCGDCNKTFSPFPRLLGIHSRHRLTRELERMICSLVKDTSFAKTARTVNLFCDLQLSPRTIHHTVHHYGEKAKIVEDLTSIPRLESDSTKINASPNERGIDVHIALAVGASSRKGTRTIRKKTLAAIEVAKSPEKTKRLLKHSQIDQLIVDGRSGLDSYIDDNELPITVQRCLWHIPRTAVHMLHEDGLSAPVGRELIKSMRGFLFDESLPVKTRREKYDTLIRQFRENNYLETCTFLENARKNLFTYKQFAEQDLYGRTISVAERQMREVNRRMENGSRWTPAGAQRLLTLKLIEELNPISHQYLWKVRKKQKSSFQVILC
jgi:hypothetical protein